MSLLDQLQKLDALFIEHTMPPVTPILRRHLALTVEQIEAYSAASERQDQTLATQAQTVAELQAQNDNLVATVAELQAQNKAAATQAVESARKIETMAHALSHYEREQRHRDAAQAYPEDALRGIDAGG